MNILKHPIYKGIYDLCQEIEKLPPSEHATKLVVMAGELEKPANALVGKLELIANICRSDKHKNPIADILRVCSDS